jgi:hypothetical protein
MWEDILVVFEGINLKNLYWEESMSYKKEFLKQNLKTDFLPCGK